MLLKDLTYVKSPVARDSEFCGNTFVQLDKDYSLGIDKFVRAGGRIEFDIVLYGPSEDYETGGSKITIDYGMVDPVRAQCILHEWTAGDANAA